MLKVFTGVLLAMAVASVAAIAVAAFIKRRFPARIPPGAGFEHELASERTLREIAEVLAARFPGPTADNVVCLGPVRGNAARILFHSGPNNRGANVNIHRADYVLHVRRRQGPVIVLSLELNRPYSSFRVRRHELGPLVRALQSTYGALASV